MTIDRRYFVKNLRQLVREPGTFNLKNIKAVVPNELTVGKYGNSKPPAWLNGKSYLEVYLIWSEVLVTEEGVFEMPTNWPDENTYDGFEFDDADLPVVGDPYLIQRRVHAYVYSVAGAQEVHELLTVFGKPFEYADQPIPFPLDGSTFIPIMKDLGKSIYTNALRNKYVTAT